MRSYLSAFLFLLAVTLPLPALALGSVNVMTDSDLSVVITQLARNYSRDNDTIVNTSFTAPKTQQAQITEGGAADILITPSKEWIEQLKTQGLIDVYSETSIAKNRLVLVGPLDSPLQVNLARGFPTAAIIKELGGEPGFVIGSPDTLEEGIYGKEALHKMQVAADLEPYTLYIKQRDQMFEAITERKAYGIFFYSSTVGRLGVKVLDLFPENTYKAAQYYAVVIAGDNMDEARKFLEYLKSKKAKRVFIDNGYFTD